MKNLLVTGADGQLGHFVKKSLAAAGVSDVTFTTVAELDLSTADDIHNYFVENGNFKIIINLAAYTAVDLAEIETAKAKALNSEAPALLAAYAERFIHISTDFVFGGEKKSPYSESDKPQPLSVYGQTKHEGEVRLMQASSHVNIIRTSWLYSELPSNFLTNITKYSRQKPELSIVNDQRGTPTYAGDLANVLVKIVQQGLAPGIYHYSNEGETTWFEFAKYFLAQQGIQTLVKPISTKEYETSAAPKKIAPRPAYSVFDKAKIKRELNLKIAFWQESVKLCLQKMS